MSAKSHRHLGSAIIVLLTLLAASGARADEDAQVLRHDVRVNFGLASAVGVFGVTYSYMPLRVLELEAGAGWGFSGLQLSAMPKLSLGVQQHRFLVGVGVSTSLDPFESDNAVDDGVRVSAWLNAEVGYSFRAASNWSLLLAGGLTAGLAGEMHTAGCFMGCADPHEPRELRGRVSPQFRVASGWWF